MKKSNVIKVMAIAASALFLTGCPMGFDFTEPPHQTTAAHKLADIDDTVFPDPVFREYVLTHIDLNKDGILTSDESHGLKVLEVNGMGIVDLTGVDYFTSLLSLNCSGNSLVKLDVSRLDSLNELNCNNNPLKELDVSGNRFLSTLRVADTLLTSLDVSESFYLNSLSVDKEVELIGADQEDLIVMRVTRPSHPEWETDSR